VLALFAIATGRWRMLAIALWLLTAVTFVGSLALGWHYAVDGYAGLLLAALVWLVARHAVDLEADDRNVLVLRPQARKVRPARVPGVTEDIARERPSVRLSALVAGAIALASVPVLLDDRRGYPLDDEIQVANNVTSEPRWRVRHSGVRRGPATCIARCRPSRTLTCAGRCGSWLYHLTSIPAARAAAVLVSSSCWDLRRSSGGAPTVVRGAPVRRPSPHRELTGCWSPSAVSRASSSCAQAHGRVRGMAEVGVRIPLGRVSWAALLPQRERAARALLLFARHRHAQGDVA
jgi:hypothetical protein